MKGMVADPTILGDWRGGCVHGGAAQQTLLHRLPSGQWHIYEESVRELYPDIVIASPKHSLMFLVE